jgi:hypothetical protein
MMMQDLMVKKRLNRILLKESIKTSKALKTSVRSCFGDLIFIAREENVLPCKGTSIDI